MKREIENYNMHFISVSSNWCIYTKINRDIVIIPNFRKFSKMKTRWGKHENYYFLYFFKTCFIIAFMVLLVNGVDEFL
jgi:hypothetical protein